MNHGSRILRLPTALLLRHKTGGAVTGNDARCVAKAPFTRMKTALEAAENLTRECAENGSGKVFRVYTCRTCGLFHLTTTGEGVRWGDE